MARILVASSAGACYGVERALKLVDQARMAHSGPLYTLGPLIHNPQVVSELEAAGVHKIEEVSEAAPGSVVVLRTHGVLPEVEEAARTRGLEVVDATCPYVTKTHLAAEQLAREGYQVVIAGEEGHPEVVATQGHAPGALVVADAAGAQAAPLERKVGLIVQTTQAEENFEAIVAAIAGRVEELRVINTICTATHERQAAAAELAAQVACMVVIGGHNSANTGRLAEICAATGTETHHIERIDELDPRWFVGKETIGVTAGASTPAAQIDAVVSWIDETCGAATE